MMKSNPIWYLVDNQSLYAYSVLHLELWRGKNVNWSSSSDSFWVSLPKKKKKDYYSGIKIKQFLAVADQVQCLAFLWTQ